MAKKKPTLLRKLKLDEISLVDTPANPGATVLFAKRGDGEPMDFNEALTDDERRDAAMRAMDSLYEGTRALCNSIESILSSDGEGDTAEAIRESLEQFGAYMDGVVPALAGIRKSIEEFGLPSASGGATPINPVLEAFDMTVEELSKKLEEAEAANVELTKRAEEAEAKVEELAKAGGEAEAEDDILKGMPDAVRKAFEEQAEKNAELEARLNKAADEAKIADFRKVAGDTMSSLPGVTSEELAPLLKSINDKLDPSEAASVTALLAKSSEVISKTAFSELGGAGAPSEDSAEAKLNKRAEEIAKSEGVSSAVAFTKATQENPSLYSAYIAEKRSGAN